MTHWQLASPLAIYSSAVYLIEPAFRLLFEADESLPMDYIENVEQV